MPGQEAVGLSVRFVKKAVEMALSLPLGVGLFLP